jgi:hypothetical protein
MRARFADIKKHGHEGTELRRVFELSENIALVLGAPLVGLLYILTFALVGTAALFCYGLKALGVKCRIFHR